MTDWRALGRRARACRGWRPLPGMLYEGPLGGLSRWNGEPFEIPAHDPVFWDPATLGCLLALVREAWGDPDIYVERVWDPSPDPKSSGWLARGSGPPTRRSVTGTWPSEAECLVEALEAAPVRR